MRVLDLFSGIGGFSLGLERAGMTTVAFCEIDPFCRAVLKKHWPEVPCYDDIRTLTAERLAADGIAVDVICGGFPCQDISFAGKGAGLAGERSGLWSEYARLIGELEPRFVVVENVAALLSRGLGDVLGDLAALGYDAEWHCIPASAVGAPHRRDRVWIIANAAGDGWAEGSQITDAICPGQSGDRHGESSGICSVVANAAGERCGEARQYSERSSQWIARGGQILADADSEGSQGRGHVGGAAAYAQAGQSLLCHEDIRRQWVPEPAVGRVAHGVPSRVDRLRSLGNAVVPQIPEIIGKAIMKVAA